MNSKLDIVLIDNTEKLKSICHKKKVYLYGAGNQSTITRWLLGNIGISVCGFVVSCPDKNPKKKEELCVIGAEEYIDDNSVLLFAIETKDYNVCRNIVSKCINSIYVFDSFFFDKLIERYSQINFNQFFDNDVYKYIDTDLVEKNHILCKYQNNGELIFRLPIKFLYREIIERLTKKNLLDCFEEEYGEFNFLPYDDTAGIDEKKYNIYMARCHVDKEIDMPGIPDWIIPIQTGATLTDMEICDIRDNQGDNISERNRNYSECTAIYWMWKNAPKTDYIGLCHYRRHFYIPDNDISLIGCNNYDIVTTVPTVVIDAHQYFRNFVTEEDLNILCDVVKKYFPEYYDSTIKYYSSIFCPPCNMFIMKYEIFQEYGEFVFGVCEKIHEYYEKKKVIRNDRYMGYLVENLTDIFLMQHKNEYKIGYTNMKFYR